MFNQMRENVMKMRYVSGVNQEPDQYKQKLEAKTNWYLDQVKKMDLEILSMPEEAYYLAYQFEGKLLNSYALKLTDAIRVDVNTREKADARRLMSDLVESTRRSQSFVESADALAFCGLMEYQMDEYSNSMFFLEKAARTYMPDSHKRVLVTWMGATVCMKNTAMPSWRQQAIGLSEQAINGTCKLGLEADKRNDQNKRQWYDARRTLMQEILKDL